jgi:hypothetical protein
MQILALAGLTGLPLMAQQPVSRPTASGPQPQTSSRPSETPGGTSTAEPVSSTANSPEIGNPELRPVTGELVSKLDTKSAKAGDSVIVKTTEKATTAHGIEIPKGSKIVGRITDVEPRGTGNENCRVTIQFDQAQIKGGENLPIRSVIQAVAPPAGEGGARASLSRGATAPGGAPQSASAGGPPAVGTVVARNGNIAIRTTAIPGLLVAGNENGQPFSNAAGALLGARQDVHLDGGTMMVVAIAAAPSSMNGR